MQINDFVKVNYSGKIKETGLEFDKGENLPIIVGVNYTLRGIDKALLEMQLGERRTVEVVPEDGFGNREAKLVKLVPLSEFKKHNTDPAPGMVIEADGLRGRVLSVSGGRIKVDFNHPLAGKTLIYDLEIKERIEGIENKIKAIIKLYVMIEEDKSKINIREKEVDIEIPPLVNSVYKRKIAHDIMKFLEFEKVNFIESFEKPKEEVKEN
jgi:peptidylprolyl isomerase/FKBP-type peptidyl-prolyl cis-trans isomerase SlyD